MGVVPWVQRGHPVFKFRHELKYLSESLGVTFTVEQPLSLNGINRAMQSTANVKFSARLCMDKATETQRWTGVKCIWTCGEQPQLLMASAVIPCLYITRWKEQGMQGQCQGGALSTKIVLCCATELYLRSQAAVRETFLHRYVS